jgi:hypothetical protein
MLAMLEHEVTNRDGAWAFADTDSMAIVATEHGGLIPCDGGPHRDRLGESVSERFLTPRSRRSARNSRGSTPTTPAQ